MLTSLVMLMAAQAPEVKGQAPKAQAAKAQTQAPKAQAPKAQAPKAQAPAKGQAATAPEAACGVGAGVRGRLSDRLQKLHDRLANLRN